MFSCNKCADKTACVVRRLIFECNKVGVHTSTKVNSEMSVISSALLFLNSQPLSGAILPKIKACTFIYIPSMCMWAVTALAISRGCSGSSGPSLLAYAISTIIL